MKLGWVAAPVCLALASGLCGVARAEARFALAIANNIGAATDEPLAWAEQDAERFLSLFEEVGGVADDRRLLVSRAKPLAIERAFARLAGKIEEVRRAGERTAVFILYSGHADELTLHLDGESLPLARLRQLVIELPADAAVAFIDTCHAGGIMGGRAKGLASAPGFDLSLAREVGPKGRVFFASAGSAEVALESDAFGSSHFLHHLVSGLRGGGDYDRDGKVTLGEAYRYVYSRTLVSSHAAGGTRQHPELAVDLAGEGEIVLAELQRARARIELPPTLAGTILIIDDNTGEVVAEVEKHPGDELALALPAGRYRAQVRNQDGLAAARIAMPWGGRHVLSPFELAPLRSLAAVRRGGAQELRRNEVDFAVGLAKSLDSHEQGFDLAVGWAQGIARTIRLLIGGRYGRNHALGELWRIITHETSLTAGASVVAAVGPASVAGSLSLGPLAITQQLVRRDAARLEAVYPSQERRWSLGGQLVAALEVRLLLVGDWFALAQGEVRAMALRKEAHVGLEEAASLRLGGGCVF